MQTEFKATLYKNKYKKVLGYILLIKSIYQLSINQIIYS